MKELIARSCQKVPGSPEREAVLEQLAPLHAAVLALAEKLEGEGLPPSTPRLAFAPQVIRSSISASGSRRAARASASLTRALLVRPKSSSTP